MRRNNAEQIGDMIRKFFRQNGLESPLNEYRLVEAWKDVVGPTIARYTSNLYIKNQIYIQKKFIRFMVIRIRRKLCRENYFYVQRL